MDLLSLYCDCGIRRLPVDPRSLARHLGFSLRTYEQFCRDSGESLLSLLHSHNPDAFTHILPNGPVIVYNRWRRAGTAAWKSFRGTSRRTVFPKWAATVPISRVTAA